MRKIVLIFFAIMAVHMPINWQVPGLSPVLPKVCLGFRWDTPGEPRKKTDRIQIQGIIVDDTEHQQQNKAQVMRPYSASGSSDRRRSVHSLSENPAQMVPVQHYYYMMSHDRESLQLYSQDRDLWEQFAHAFGREIMKKSSDLAFINKAQYYSDENGPSELAGFAIYEDELEEIEYIRRDIAVNTLSHALVRTLEQTAPGKKIKDLEKRITDYLKMEYSKSVFDESGTLYLPGHTAPDLSEEEKEYTFSFSSSFHVDADSLSPELSVRAVADFHEFLANLLYDFSNNDASLIFENRKISAMLGAKTVLAFIYEDDVFRTECDVSFDF